MEEINKTLSAPVDMTAFERGNIVLPAEMTDTGGSNLIQSGQEITIQTQNGRHDEDILQELKLITASKPDIRIISRYENENEKKGAVIL